MIRSIDSTKYVSTLAGNMNLKFGFVDGLPLVAKIGISWGLCFDPFTNRLVISDASNNAIRFVDIVTGEIKTYVGHGLGSDSGKNGTANGPVSDAFFMSPRGICIDPFGNCKYSLPQIL